MAELLPGRFVLVPLAPRLAEYQQFRGSAGLRERTDAQAIGALRGSWAFCHIRAPGGAVVAMGRVVGDGGWLFTIADVATLPGYRRRGLGGRVLSWLLAQIAARAPKDPDVTLVADPSARGWYERAGFRKVVAPFGVGMQMVLARG
jgi:ribosomal protein S18 acetylase RimI-like enzyme